MEPNHTEELAGLESLGNSQVVNNIGDFLSLEDLGLKPDPSNEFINLDRVEEEKTPTTPVDDLTSIQEPTTVEVVEGAVELPVIKKDENEDLDSLHGLEEGETEIETNVQVTSTNSEYKTFLKDLISEGLLDDIEAFETEEGQVSFEDMDIDRETLLSIIKNSQDEKLKTVKETSIDVNGVSEFTKKLIEIEKHGGNVQQALDTYESIKRPIDTIDMETPLGQKAMCYLRLQAQGIDETTAKDLIKSYEYAGTLEEKALAAKEQLNSAFEQSIEQQKQIAIDEELAFKQSLKTYRVSLDNVLKDQNLSDTHRRKMLDIATKLDDSGEVELDRLLDDFRKNPVNAVDLLLFITDKEGFIKKKAEVALKEERKSTLRTVNIIPKGRTGSLKLDEQESKIKGDDYLFDLSKIK